MEETIMQLREENSELRRRLEVLEKSNYLLKIQNEMNEADNDHLEKILRDIKDRLSYL